MIASAEDILSWSYGEITKPETINYRTFKPEKYGLFDERIFGPHKDYECACGKYKRVRFKGIVCDKCGVEVTSSKVRRERMGHISLHAPVAHVWFFKSIPSKIATLLDILPRSLESVIYFSSYIVTDIKGSGKAKAISEVEKDLKSHIEFLNKEMEQKIEEFSESKGEEIKAKKGVSAEEAESRLNQQIQKIKNAYSDKIADIQVEYNLYIKKIESISLHSIISDSEYLVLSKYLDMFCELGIGAEAIRSILEKMDLNQISADLKNQLETAKEVKAAKILKRLKVVEGFRRSNLNPDRMVMTVVPVIPCDLRAIVPIEGGKVMSFDLNDLYQRVINRNNRLKKLMDLGAPELMLRNEKRMLQEAVDSLFDSSKQRFASKSKGSYSNKKQLKSIADSLKGKNGRFRQNLLGKRVDYSGRSVIINMPNVRVNECGIPREMALELFKPMVLREIMLRGFAPNDKTAKIFLENRSGPVYDILEDVVKGYPVLLNRAPTLWRLGFQAFYPKLIDGDAIGLHLCVTTPFNADFDGDQMAVHVPLSEEAIKEAKELMISTNNLLKPSDGNPIISPTKEIIWGIYYITRIDESSEVYAKTFSNFDEVLYLFNATKELTVSTKVRVRHQGSYIETTPGRIIFNEVLPGDNFRNITFNKKAIEKEILNLSVNASNQEIADFIDTLKEIGLKYGTTAGQSASSTDLQIPHSFNEIIEEGKAKVEELNRALRRGLATQNDVRLRASEIWEEVRFKVKKDLWESLGKNNLVKLLIESGASKATQDSINQIAGVKGQVLDASGRKVDFPILGNYRQGLTGFEYFLSSKGARKGLTDRALKTAEAGYLSRKLVDVSQDVIIRSEDCETNEGLPVKVETNPGQMDFTLRFNGRFLAKDVKSGNKIIAKAGSQLTQPIGKEIKDLGVSEIIIRSPLHCKAKKGICQKCYGNDLMTNKLVGLGTPVGVVSAQVVGEPGTQMTMRTFWGGGISGASDITVGLQRVVEILEARDPKDQAIISEIDGTVRVYKTGDDRKVIVEPSSKDENICEYVIEMRKSILVEDGQKIVKGQALTNGHSNLTDLQRLVGVDGVKKYIIESILQVYSSQGIGIADVYIETIVKQMFNHVRIEESGDTIFMVGEIVTRYAFEEQNSSVLASGGTPAIGNVVLLGIKKAAISSDSFLSAASFEQTSQVLTDAAASGKVDMLEGLKENIILGKLIPVGKYVKRI
jgi:DNA-directed RNA polymerase subunit beta'